MGCGQVWALALTPATYWSKLGWRSGIDRAISFTNGPVNSSMTAALLRRRKVGQAPNDLDAVFLTRNGTWH